MGEIIISFLVGFVVGVFLCMIEDTLNKIDPNRNIRANDKKLNKVCVKQKHYLVNDPMYPITLHELRTYAYQQQVDLEELVRLLDGNGYVIQWVKGKYVPCFSYLTVEQTVFEKYDPEGYVKLKIMTKEYRNEEGKYNEKR